MSSFSDIPRPTVPSGEHASMSGQMIRPGDPDYETARRAHNRAFDRHPAYIVRCRGTDDVIGAVRFAQENGLPLAVRSGGHSVAGHSVIDDAVVVDLSPMNGMTLDPERRVAAAQPGLTWGAYTARTHEHGLATPAGDTASVGVGGLTLGGGVGWLTRKYGMTIDNLLSVEIVTAGGEVLTASAEENPDLFWAVRGGGGNFGVVTRFEFRLLPLGNVVTVGNVLAGFLVYPPEPQVLTAYVQAAAQAPDELTTIANLFYAPPLPFLPPDLHGKLVFLIGLCWSGDRAEGERATAPLRSLGGPLLAQMMNPMPYPALFQFTEQASVSQPESIRSLLLDALDQTAAETIIDHYRRPTAPITMAQFRVLGGAMARVPPDATAFAHRDKPIMLGIVAMWEDTPAGRAEAGRHRAWTEALWRTLKPQSVGAYVNFMGDEGQETVRDAYPAATYRRLAEIKRRYDPTNLFRANWNIPPSG